MELIHLCYTMGSAGKAQRGLAVKRGKSMTALLVTGDGIPGASASLCSPPSSPAAGWEFQRKNL